MSALRSLAKLLVVLNLVVSTQGLLFVQGMFALRRDYVAERLCVNREVPESDCHGRCFLERQQERQQEQERRAAGLDLQLAVSSVLPAAAGVPAAPERTAPVPVRADGPGPVAGAPLGVFHPPRPV